MQHIIHIDIAGNTRNKPTHYLQFDCICKIPTTCLHGMETSRHSSQKGNSCIFLKGFIEQNLLNWCLYCIYYVFWGLAIFLDSQSRDSCFKDSLFRVSHFRGQPFQSQLFQRVADLELAVLKGSFFKGLADLEGSRFRDSQIRAEPWK